MGPGMMWTRYDAKAAVMVEADGNGDGGGGTSALDELREILADAEEVEALQVPSKCSEYAIECSIECSVQEHLIETTDPSAKSTPPRPQ